MTLAADLWLFWTYSFLGYLLEKGFAAVTGGGRRGRRCRLLLPLCPVYGAGVLAVMCLPPELTDSFWGMALWGGAAATAVEYAVHWWYEAALGVRFWDYSGVPWNLGGRVCLPFSAAWGLLLAVCLPPLQQALAPVLAAVPPWLTWAALGAFGTDAFLTGRLLLETGDPESARPPLLRRGKRQLPR